MIADGSLAASQYRGMVITEDFTVGVLTDANAQRPIGILQNDPDAAGEAADVAYDGICKARAGGAITYGQTLIFDNSGDLIADAEVVDGSAVDIHHVADALQDLATGQVGYVLLHTPIRIGKE